MALRSRQRVLLCGVLLGLAGIADAAGLRLAVVGAEAGREAPLADAVASLHPTGPAARPVPGTPAGVAGTVEIDQRNATFVPAVLPVQAGTRVGFPNSDNTLHHVYSYSRAKRFELPLYSGQRAPPVTFDQPGVVTLGCNIHDWMVAHVVVLDTPWHGRSRADGQIVLQAPAGDYVLRVWHPRAAAPLEQRVTLAGLAGQQVARLALVPPPVLPVRQDGRQRLRALQEQLRTR